MPRILACIDSSSYANSVCDHAGWLAGRSEATVDVLHAVDPASAKPRQGAASDAALDYAVGRLNDEGVAEVGRLQLVGDFVQVAERQQADLIVMGKRGDRSELQRRRLGSSVDPMIRATTVPVCLTSKLFLPIRRGLILLDADLSHTAAVAFVAEHPSFAGLEMDMVVVARPGQDAGPKLDWARAALPHSLGDIFALEAEGLDPAASQYIEQRAADIVVVSRAVIAPAPETQLSRIEERGVWGMRTPVVIC